MKSSARLSVLDSLAPVVPDTGRYTGKVTQVARTLKQHEPLDVARRQAKRLNRYVWPAMAAYLNRHKKANGVRGQSFSAGDLKTLFLQISQVCGIAQTQTPAIFACTDTSELHGFLRPHNSGSVYFSDVAGGFHDNPRLTSGLNYIYGFVSLKKDRNDFERLLSLPYVGMDSWMLDQFVKKGTKKTLAAFQSCVAAINHDYYHMMTPYLLTPYFSGANLSREKLPGPFKVLFEETDLSRKWRGNVLDGSSRIELNALLMHNSVFKIMWRDPAFRREFEADMRIYVEGVAAIAKTVECDANNLNKNSESFTFAALCLFGAFILRAVDSEHPLMNSFVSMINKTISLSDDYLARQSELAMYGATDRSGGNYVRLRAVQMSVPTFGDMHSFETKKKAHISHRLTLETMMTLRQGVRRLNVTHKGLAKSI